MARAIGPADIERLERAFAEAGFRAQRITDSRPWRFAFDDELLGRLAVHMWPLHDSGDRSRDRHRIVLSWKDGERPSKRQKRHLVLGYDRGHDLYVHWPWAHALRLARGASLWVSADTLRSAQRHGLAWQHGGPGRSPLAFEPAMMWQALALLGLLESPSSAAELRHERGPRVQHPADSTRGYEVAPRDMAEPQGPPVETGFMAISSGRQPVSRRASLRPDTAYAFWFSIGGALRKFSIETSPAVLPETPSDAILTVQLFPFAGELHLTGEARGTFTLDADGRSVVVTPPESAPLDLPDPAGTLHFPVHTPPQRGDARLRCNVYLGSTLLQSRIVTAYVGGDRRGRLLRSKLDYAVTERFDAEPLAAVPEHLLSIMVNGNDASHQFRFFSDAGTERFANDASLTSAEVDGAISAARGALQGVAWGAAVPWDSGAHRYRYATRPLASGLAADLKLLASKGRGLYLPLVRKLAGGVEAREELEALTVRTGAIQIATAAGGMYLPAGMFYDHKLADTRDHQKLELCPVTAAALARKSSFAEMRCLDGRCEWADDPRMVCVSGFWGFRHDLGWPLATKEPLTELRCAGRAVMTIGVSTDAGLRERDAHVARVSALAESTIAESEDELTAALQGVPPNVLYFYCHGGIHGAGTPYIEVGEPGSSRITESYFSNYGVRFTSPDRPVVFINGCHTAAMTPSQLLSLVDGFVLEGNAVGVVGTEITVFESLAVRFAEAVLEAFLDGSHTIGSAVRHARLRLLDEGNPLGLVYVPFVAAPTRLLIT